jgi:hypothetical protein
MVISAVNMVKLRRSMKTQPPDINIVTIRGQKVVLDADLALVYEVTTKRLNEQLRRNRKRFPADFAFRLTKDEANRLWSQIATASSSARLLRSQNATASSRAAIRSQNATASKRNIRYRPWAFTEHGALQVANILRSQRAIAMSVGACPERSRMGHPRVYRAARESRREFRNPETSSRDR